MPYFSTLKNEQPYGLYKNITTSTLIKAGEGNVQAIVVASHTNGTIKLWDSLTGGGSEPVLINTYTYTVGPQTIQLYGAHFLTGLYADTNSTTQNITIIYN